MMPTYVSLGDKGGLASEIYFATIEGLKILENGGNAFDAAITVSSVLSVLMPYMTSVGGDGFLLAVDNGTNLVAYNGSGRSPREFPVDDYLAEKPLIGPLTVTVPGLVDLWEWVNENYGSMKLDLLLKKSASLAKNGFYVHESFARTLELWSSLFAECQSWKKNFGWMQSNSRICFPKLASVYTAVARRGADAFYRSKLTEDIAEELRKEGVPITYEDFAEHKGEKMTPIKCEYRDYDLYELPPNSQGLSTLQLLKAMEVAELNKLPLESPERIKEFFKLAAGVYEDRDRYVADPNYSKTPLDWLFSPNYLKEKFCKGFRSQGELNPGDTTNFVVGDKHGNLVGFIQSLSLPFGSGIVAQDIPFQNRGAGFAKNLELPNSPAPRKRPLHTLSILLARHSSHADYLIGCAGGDLRPQIHSEVFTNVADYHMSLSEAVEAPRYILTSWQENELKATVEDSIWAHELPSWAEKIGFQLPMTGIVHGMKKRPDGVLEFAADPRGGGIAASLL